MKYSCVVPILVALSLSACKKSGPEKLTKTFTLDYYGYQLDLPEEWDWMDGKKGKNSDELGMYSISTSPEFSGVRSFHTEDKSQRGCPSDLEMLSTALAAQEGVKILGEHQLPTGFGVSYEKTFVNEKTKKTFVDKNYVFYFKPGEKCLMVHNNIYNDELAYFPTELAIFKTIRVAAPAAAKPVDK